MKRFQGIIIGIILACVILIGIPALANGNGSADNSITAEKVQINPTSPTAEPYLQFGGYYQGEYNQNVARLWYRDSDYPALNLSSDFGTTLYINMDSQFNGNVVFTGDVKFNGMVDFSNANVIGLK